MAQKNEERHFLECFLREAQIEPMNISDHERPDFILSFWDGEVGVEVTKLHKRTHPRQIPERVRESIADRIVQKAHQFYKLKESVLTRASILFNPGHDLRELNRDEVANEIADLIASFNLRNGQRVQWRPDYKMKHRCSSVSYIEASEVPNPRHAYWDSPKAGWPASLSREDLNERIVAKSSLLTDYRDAVSRIWLLIVADRRKPSQMFEYEGTFDPSTLEHPFDRAYYYSFPDNLILKLGSTAQDIASPAS